MIITKEEAVEIVRKLKGECLSHPKWGKGVVIETEPDKLKFKVKFEGKIGEYFYPNSFSMKHLSGNVKVHKIEDTFPKTTEKTEKKLKSKAEKKIESQMWFAIKKPFQGGTFTGK